MRSSVADAIYWLSRYLERAENVARFVQVNLHLKPDFGVENVIQQWEPLISASGDYKNFIALYGTLTEKNIIQFLTFDLNNPNSILSCVRSARDNARGIRDVLSAEMWEQINEFYLTLQREGEKRLATDPHRLYGDVIKANHLFIGIAQATMSHGEGWYFGELGRLVERADKTARMIDLKYFILLPSLEYVDTPYDTVQWGALLKSVSAFEMYRKRYHIIDYKNVTDFLIFDREFPRSLIYCLRSLREFVHLIAAFNANGASAHKKLEGLCKILEASNIDKILIAGLHEFVCEFQKSIGLVDQEIYRSFFEKKSEYEINIETADLQKTLQ